MVWGDTISWDTVRDVLPPLVAVGGAASSLYFALRGSKIQKENLRVQRDTDVLGWGNSTIDTLSKLESIALLDVAHPDMRTRFCAKQIEYMAELSATIDKGRMYFPNVQKHVHGTHKDSAFRGYRRPILDALTEAYRSGEKYKFGDTSAMQTVGKQINLARRRFVSELQKAVDPDRRLNFLARHAGVMEIDEVSEDANSVLQNQK